jgi:hypothetical protein
MQIESGAKSADIPIYPPPTELPPKPWWDAEADKSLLVGVYKHGYERYSVMRNDPALCFLARCGPPDKAALQAEMSIAVYVTREYLFLKLSSMPSTFLTQLS